MTAGEFGYAVGSVIGFAYWYVLPVLVLYALWWFPRRVRRSRRALAKPSPLQNWSPEPIIDRPPRQM